MRQLINNGHCPLILRRLLQGCASFMTGSIQGARMMWQPIETAPKDGERIDVWFELGSHAARWPNVFWDSRRERWTSGPTDQGIIHWNATHWMPLPAPPAEFNAEER